MLERFLKQEPFPESFQELKEHWKHDETRTHFSSCSRVHCAKWFRRCKCTFFQMCWECLRWFPCLGTFPLKQPGIYSHMKDVCQRLFYLKNLHLLWSINYGLGTKISLVPAVQRCSMFLKKFLDWSAWSSFIAATALAKFEKVPKVPFIKHILLHQCVGKLFSLPNFLEPGELF